MMVFNEWYGKSPCTPDVFPHKAFKFSNRNLITQRFSYSLHTSLFSFTISNKYKFISPSSYVLIEFLSYLLRPVIATKRSRLIWGIISNASKTLGIPKSFRVQQVTSQFFFNQLGTLFIAK